jgi:hypothetical protein
MQVIRRTDALLALVEPFLDERTVNSRVGRTRSAR